MDIRGRIHKLERRAPEREDREAQAALWEARLKRARARAGFPPNDKADLSAAHVRAEELENPTGMAPKDVAGALDLTDAQARQRLRRMADVGEVEKLAHGVYGPAVSQLSLCHDNPEMPPVTGD